MSKTGVKFTAYKIWETRMKAGLRVTTIDQLTPDDKKLAYEKLLEAYRTEIKDASKASKNWIAPNGSNFKKCSKLFGTDIATVWFDKLQNT